MSGMRTVVVDKIASVTQACALSHEIRITADIACEEGMVVVVEILNNKSTYNTLELTSGRMAKLARGDVVIGALGHRKALFGYSGHIPATLKPGDVIQMLNIGGVLGICDSATPDKGKPFDCKVLGAVLTFPYLGERIGVPARAGYKALDYDAALNVKVAENDLFPALARAPLFWKRLHDWAVELPFVHGLWTGQKLPAANFALSTRLEA